MDGTRHAWRTKKWTYEAGLLESQLLSVMMELLPFSYLGMGQNLVPLVNIKIAGKWMFIPLNMVLIGIDP